MPSEKVRRFRLTAVLRIRTVYTPAELQSLLRGTLEDQYPPPADDERVIELKIEELQETADAC